MNYGGIIVPLVVLDNFAVCYWDVGAGFKPALVKSGTDCVFDGIETVPGWNCVPVLDLPQV